MSAIKQREVSLSGVSIGTDSGWLTPSGSWISCHGDDHGETLIKMGLIKLPKKTPKNFDKRGFAMSEAFVHSFIRIYDLTVDESIYVECTASGMQYAESFIRHWAHSHTKKIEFDIRGPDGKHVVGTRVVDLYN